MLKTNSVTALTVDNEPTLSKHTGKVRIQKPHVNPLPNIWSKMIKVFKHEMRIPVFFGLMQHYCMMEQNRITVSSNFTGSMVGNIKWKQYQKHIHLIGHWLIWLDVDQLALQRNTGLNSNQIASKLGKKKHHLVHLSKANSKNNLWKSEGALSFSPLVPFFKHVLAQMLVTISSAPQQLAQPHLLWPCQGFSRLAWEVVITEDKLIIILAIILVVGQGGLRWGKTSPDWKVSMWCQLDYLETNIQWDFQGPQMMGSLSHIIPIPLS